ncbi:MAG TPA: hypothetical protein VI564_03690 [Candidatus Nanoarchaeia archaeon]|nr:hypothetical protein [Candidatus Nanoarchaeia archaeon]
MVKRIHVDEVILFSEVRRYIEACTNMYYQNGRASINNFSIWPLHNGR